MEERIEYKDIVLKGNASGLFYPFERRNTSFDFKCTICAGYCQQSYLIIDPTELDETFTELGRGWPYAVIIRDRVIKAIVCEACWGLYSLSPILYEENCP